MYVGYHEQLNGQFQQLFALGMTGGGGVLAITMGRLHVLPQNPRPE